MRKANLIKFTQKQKGKLVKFPCLQVTSHTTPEIFFCLRLVDLLSFMTCFQITHEPSDFLACPSVCHSSFCVNLYIYIMDHFKHCPNCQCLSSSSESGCVYVCCLIRATCFCIYMISVDSCVLWLSHWQCLPFVPKFDGKMYVLIPEWILQEMKVCQNNTNIHILAVSKDCLMVIFCHQSTARAQSNKVVFHKDLIQCVILVNFFSFKCLLFALRLLDRSDQSHCNTPMAYSSLGTGHCKHIEPLDGVQ